MTDNVMLGTSIIIELIGKATEEAIAVSIHFSYQVSLFEEYVTKRHIIVVDFGLIIALPSNASRVFLASICANYIIIPASRVALAVRRWLCLPLSTSLLLRYHCSSSKRTLPPNVCVGV
jgi:hypothetical protein